MNKAELFYRDHINVTPKFPPIPQHIASDEELVKWLFKQNIPFIDIDLEFDIEAWRKEAILALPFLVPHREGDSIGWNSCCIHGSAVNQTGVWQSYYNEEPEYNWTELSKLTPTIVSFWKSLPFERFARVRFMELEPHGNIMPHNDSPKGFNDGFDLLEHLVPFNIAVTHPDNCFMSLQSHGVIPWKNGDIRLVNITNTHSVINFSDQPRLHMIGHGIIGNKAQEFYSLIARSYRKQYEHYKI